MPDPARELIRLAMERFGNLWPAEAKMLRAAAEGTVADVADRVGDVILAMRKVGPQSPTIVTSADDDEEEHETPLVAAPRQAESAPAPTVAPPAPKIWLDYGRAARPEASVWGCWEDWGEHRAIRAEVLAWVVANEPVSALVQERGVTIVDARIVGRVVLDGASVRHPICWHRCALPDGLSVGGAAIPSIELRGCHVFGLMGEFVSIKGRCELGVLCRGTIDLARARIGGDLNLGGCSIESSWLEGERITGTGDAVVAVGIEIGGACDLEYCSIDGVVDLARAVIARELNGYFAEISNVLRCTGARIGLGVELEHSRIKGEARFNDAEIGGVLNLRHARVQNPDVSDDNGGRDRVPSLTMVRASVAGDVRLTNAECVGEIRLMGAHVRGDLLCSGTQLDGCFVFGKKWHSMVGDRLRVDGDIRLGHGAELRGEARLVEASIGGNLVCEGCLLKCGSDDAEAALRLDFARVAGDVRMRGADTRVWGDVSMRRASIGGDLQLQTLKCDGSVRLHRATIGESLHVGDHTEILGTLDFAGARASRVQDTARGWSGSSALNLSEFRYDVFSAEGAMSVDDRIAWVLRGSTGADGSLRYSPFPFQQLAMAYARMGHGDESVKVRQAQYAARRTYDKPRSFWDLGRGVKYWWRWLVIWLLGCGYNRLGPLYAMFLLWLVGGLVFQAANRQGLMVPASDQVLTTSEYQRDPGRRIPTDYQPMNVWTYSADAMLPFIDLHQERFWLPKRDPDPDRWRAIANLDRGAVFGYPFPDAGRFLRWYLWFHIAAGWMLSTLFVVGLSGIVKNEDGKSHDE